MRSIYKLFYREEGIRYSDLLISPPESHFQEFPKLSLFHYVPTEHQDKDIDTTLSYYQGYSKKIIIDFVQDYVKEEGPVKRPAFIMKELTKAWRRANIRQWELASDNWMSNNNQEQLVVLNYGYLDVIYRYLPVQGANYYRWLNRQRTVWANVNKIAASSERNQFLYFPMSQVLQGKTMLDKYAQEPFSLRVESIFGQYGWEGFMQLDFWRWLNPDWRSKSLISQVDEKHYGKVNLVFVGVSGKKVIINLGYFNSWIKGQKNSTEMGSLVQYEYLQIQKLFLKLCMSLNAVLSEDENVDVIENQRPPVVGRVKTYSEPAAVDPEDGEAEPVDTIEEQDDLETTDLDRESGLKQDDIPIEPSGVAASVSKETSPKLKQIDLDKPEKAFKVNALTTALFEDLDKDMEALDRLSLTQLKNAGISAEKETVEEELIPQINPAEIQAKVYTPKTATQTLLDKLEEDAEANLLTAADYRKLKENVASYAASPDPYGSKLPRLEAMVVKPEDTAITPEEIEIPAGDNVDDTMKESTLQVYDKKYLDKVFKKDVLRCLDAVQKGSVVIRRHEIDTMHTALGSYERHTLELKPLNGAPSTLQFTFPKIDPDATFMASGNKYLLRKQRVDLPIRKIAPQIVALSSYYGKTFVQVNEKVVNNSLTWLYRQINISMFEHDGRFTEVNPGDVFDNDFKAPFIYSALSKEYEQMRVAGKYLLNFDRKRALKTVNPALLKIIEKNGRIWTGWTKDMSPIVVDKNDQFFIIQKDKETPIGTIYEMANLNQEKQPLDFAEVRVYSKYIPLAVVLGYYLGLPALISLLGAKYRIVEGRKQKNLQDDEYAITFKDYSLIFSKKDKKASLILNGFNDYEKILKHYELKLFAHKDVYLNLLMNKRISAIYVKEMDMMESLFVDPITQEVLQEMKEPETFTGLLLRSCELLETFSHPASQDPDAMRIRGYERFAGAMYKELTTAIRQFNNKNLVGRSKIDMSPYEVWNSIMKDSAGKIAEDINPVQNLKESEIVTYSGVGGRDKDTMMMHTRAYHINDAGLMSESSVDNAGVGTVAYLSANPNFTSVRGLSKAEKKLNPVTMLSTSALISPASVHDN